MTYFRSAKNSRSKLPKLISAASCRCTWSNKNRLRTLPKPPVTKTNVPTHLPLVPSGSAGSELSLEHDGGALVRRTTLPGGVRVITEKIPGMRSAALGAWVPVGSRDEAAGAHGSSHYLEHLLFKGTQRRTAGDIARAFDAAGGEANAATSKASTCYFARVLATDLPIDRKSVV